MTPVAWRLPILYFTSPDDELGGTMLKSRTMGKVNKIWSGWMEKHNICYFHKGAVKLHWYRGWLLGIFKPSKMSLPLLYLSEKSLALLFFQRKSPCPFFFSAKKSLPLLFSAKSFFGLSPIQIPRKLFLSRNVTALLFFSEKVLTRVLFPSFFPG